MKSSSASEMIFASAYPTPRTENPRKILRIKSRESKSRALWKAAANLETVLAISVNYSAPLVKYTSVSASKRLLTSICYNQPDDPRTVSYTHLRAHETP